MANMNILKEHYVKILANIINSVGKLNISNTVEDILENLKYLTKKSDFSSDDTMQQSWLPVEYKRMLLFILFDGEALLHSTIKEYVPGKFVVASATITDKAGTLTYAYCEKRMAFEDIEPLMGYSDNKRNMLMQCYALGGAESKALTYAGIGLEFCGDIKEFAVMPSSTDNPTNEEVKFEPEIAEKMNAIMESNVPATEPTNKSTQDSDMNFYDETALEESIVVPAGTFAGKKLSELEKPHKIAGWLLANIDGGFYTNFDDALYQNLKKYVENSPTAKKAYDQTFKQNQKTA